MPTTIFTPQMLRNGTRAVPEIPAGGGGGFTNTYSLDFDGVDDRVQLSSDFVASAEFTISFWMKPTTISGNGSPYVIGRFPLLFNNYIKLDQLGRIYILINQTLVSFFEGVTGGGANNIVLNEWQNIIITRDSSNGLRCYRNGNVFGYNGAPITNSSPLTLNSIGRNYSNAYGFNGALDEIAFWNTDETANISTLSTSPTVDLTDLNPTVWLRNGDNGAYKSPQWLIPNNENKDKVSNYSFEFDGADDYIDVTLTPSTPNVSVSFWIKAPIQGAAANVFGGNGQSIFQYFGGTSSVNLVTNHYTVGWVTICTDVFDNQWHHIVVTFNKATGDLISYKDGDLNTTLNIPGFGNVNHGLNTIGSYGNGAIRFFQGIQDDISLFDSVLSQSEVTSLYNGGEPTTISGAIAHWRMGEEATFSTNWTVPDQVGSNDGTSANMTIEDRIGTAPSSSNNAVSFNMTELDRVEDVPA